MAEATRCTSCKKEVALGVTTCDECFLKATVLACCGKYPGYEYERLLVRAKELLANGRTVAGVAQLLQ